MKLSYEIKKRLKLSSITRKQVGFDIEMHVETFILEESVKVNKRMQALYVCEYLKPCKQK